jgi:hypothetical protein
MSLRGALGDSSSVLSATADVASAVVSIAVVVGLPLSVANDLLGGPLSTPDVQIFVLAAALVGAYPFVAGGWPLGKLTDFALAAVLAAFGFSALVGVGLLVSGAGGLPSDAPASTAVAAAVVVASFVVAAAYVRHRECGHGTGPAADAGGH